MMERYYGKYRGKVENNIDPLQLGRIQVSVPAVLGEGRFSWAMPCTPYAGPDVGLFLVPPTGANVWVEFEGGDPDYPIWAGCFWGKGEVPVAPGTPALAEVKILRTEHLNMMLNDLPSVGGFTLEVKTPSVPTPMKMVFDKDGILIDHSPGTIVMTQQKIEAKHTSPTVTITPSEIESKNSSSSTKVTASSVEVTASATGKFSPSGVELKNGGQSVNIGAANVSINNGALEVI